MANPLLKSLGVSQKAQVQVQQKPKNVVQAFKEFKATFNGDPQAAINELISSGQRSQADLDKATQWANMVRGLLKK